MPNTTRKSTQITSTDATCGSVMSSASTISFMPECCEMSRSGLSILAMRSALIKDVPGAASAISELSTMHASKQFHGSRRYAARPPCATERPSRGSRRGKRSPSARTLSSISSTNAAVKKVFATPSASIVHAGVPSRSASVSGSKAMASEEQTISVSIVLSNCGSATSHSAKRRGGDARGRQHSARSRLRARRKGKPSASSTGSCNASRLDREAEFRSSLRTMLDRLGKAPGAANSSDDLEALRGGGSDAASWKVSSSSSSSSSPSCARELSRMAMIRLSSTKLPATTSTMK
mmetsp:Transcript_19074/g.48575  ORF Transcript_19074/g.48575 Transcript_19074/m.48575 type:complete len:292 (-) Transcript_19074:1800-2675(-)